MKRVRAYPLVAAWLAILVGLATLIGVLAIRPGYAEPPDRDVFVTNTPANPVPVVVQGGDPNQSMVVTLAENVSGQTEFDAVDVRPFRFVSVLGKAGGDAGGLILIAFSTEPGRFSDDIPKVIVAQCSLYTSQQPPAGVRECRTMGGIGAHGDNPFPVGGPYLLVQLYSGSSVALKVFLSK